MIDVAASPVLTSQPDATSAEVIASGVLGPGRLSSTKSETCVSPCQ